MFRKRNKVVLREPSAAEKEKKKNEGKNVSYLLHQQAIAQHLERL
jgi:hypothetical protein